MIIVHYSQNVNSQIWGYSEDAPGRMRRLLHFPTVIDYRRMGQALYRKWRPQTFDDLIGQEHVVRTLRNALRMGQIHHAYLFAGPRGTGKTTTARLLAKAVNCLAPVEERPCNRCEICRAVNEGRLMDLIEIDAASHTGVDNVRDILEKVPFRPSQARYKVYVIDEAHMLSTSAFNALLKTLEEPPEHVIFVLATTEPHRILPTVLSRCQRFEFRRIPMEAIATRLRTICTAEGIEAEEAALELIARAATGSLRDAISLLDQMASAGEVTVEAVRRTLGSGSQETVQAIARAWIEGETAAGLRAINAAVDQGADARQLARQLSDFLRGLMLTKLGAGNAWIEPTAEEREALSALAARVSTEALVRATRLFAEVAATRSSGWRPQLPLELAFVEATLKPAPTPPSPARKPARETTARTARRNPSPASGSPPLDSAIAALQKQWRKLCGQMKPVNLSLSALLNDARPLAWEGETLVLGFRHNFHRQRVNQEENRRTVEDFLSEKLGRPVRVRCVLTSEWRPSASPPPARSKPAPKAPAAAAPKAAAQEAPPPPPGEDEFIRRAVEELGATVREG